MTTWAEILTPESVVGDRFVCRTPASDSTRVFGGQLVAQALYAAGQRAPHDRAIHSVHSRFTRPGDPLVPIEYQVQLLHDGRTFSSRRVVARQGDETIFELSASFCAITEGQFQHQLRTIDFDDPEPTPLGDVTMKSADARTRMWWSRIKQRHPVEIRYVTEPLRAQIARGVRPDPR